MIKSISFLKYMPIHINLLAEAQAAEEMRRRDPVKRAIFIGVSLAAVALMWSAVEAVEALLVKGQLTTVLVAIDVKTNAYQNVVLNQKKIEAYKNKIATLDKLQAARFLQGNLLDALQHCTVNNVQLTSLAENQSYTLTEKKAAKEGAPAPPSTVTEKIILRLDARDSSPNPGDQINNFKDAIAAEPYFRSMLNKANPVQLAGPPSVPQIDTGKPYVTFTLLCNFANITR
jgi:hypothetical protein